MLLEEKNSSRNKSGRRCAECQTKRVTCERGLRFRLRPINTIEDDNVNESCE